MTEAGTPEPVPAALIGVGMVTSAYAAALKELRSWVALVGVLGRRAESAGAFLAEHGAGLGSQVRARASVEDIAGDPDIAFVMLTTPPNARLQIVETLAAAGKHILMEKPVERTLDAAAKLRDICEAHGVQLGIMLQHRVRPSALRLQDIVAGGALGSLQTAEISVPWWRPQAYYEEPERGTYARDGGGVLISQAIHTLDLALQFTGPVATVTALTATSSAHEMEAEDFVSAGLTFANGAVGALLASTASYPGRAEEIILHFANASVRLQSSLLDVHWRDGRHDSLGASTATGAGADPMAFTSDWHRDMIVDFVDAIRDGREPRASVESALPVHAVIEAIERSGRSGCREEVRQVHAREAA